VKMKKTLQDNNQKLRITSLNATEIGIHEIKHDPKFIKTDPKFIKHDPKFISALEEWYLRKVCYILVFLAFFLCVCVYLHVSMSVYILYKQLLLNFKVFSKYEACLQGSKLCCLIYILLI
jgi:hypothetical protein